MNVNDIEKYKVPVDKLRNDCSICGDLNFCQTSKDVSVLEGVIGQDRAVKSMEFGLSMEASGYNILFRTTGTGKTTYTQTVVSRLHPSVKYLMTGVISITSVNGTNHLQFPFLQGRAKCFKDMENL